MVNILNEINVFFYKKVGTLNIFAKTLIDR